MKAGKLREKNHKLGGVFMILFVINGIKLTTIAILSPLYPLFILVLILLSPIGFVTRTIINSPNLHHLSPKHKPRT